GGGRGTVKVYVEVLEPDNRLFPELLANVYFLPRSDEGGSLSDRAGERALYIPVSAVVERDDKTFTWVVNRDGVIRLQPITLQKGQGRARVDQGLKEGESVVLAAPQDLADGQVVATKD